MFSGRFGGLAKISADGLFYPKERAAEKSGACFHITKSQTEPANSHTEGMEMDLFEYMQNKIRENESPGKLSASAYA